MNPLDNRLLLRLRDVEAHVGLRRSTIYLLISRNEFPAPIKIGAASCWSRKELDAWVETRLSERGVAAA